MVYSTIGALAGILLLLLLVLEKGEKKNLRLSVKTALSCLFVLTALLQPTAVAAYGKFILIGLVFCLAGDVCLALEGDKIFRAGLVAFLTGHIFYVLGFSHLVTPAHWALPGALLFWGFSFLVFLWLKPHLKTMQVPVAVYILVITVMACGAWAVFSLSPLSIRGRGAIFLGAILFYASDIFVARNQFVKRQFVNRLIGLPLYYGGQFLLAFSVGLR